MLELIIIDTKLFMHLIIGFTLLQNNFEHEIFLLFFRPTISHQFLHFHLILHHLIHLGHLTFLRRDICIKCLLPSQILLWLFINLNLFLRYDLLKLRKSMCILMILGLGRKLCLNFMHVNTNSLGPKLKSIIRDSLLHIYHLSDYIFICFLIAFL